LFKKLLKVSNVLNLARLGDAVAFRGKPPLCIKFHHLISFLKNSQKQKEATDDGTSSSLSMIAMKNSDSLRINS